MASVRFGLIFALVIPILSCRRAPGSEAAGQDRLVATFRTEPKSFNRVVSSDPAQFLLGALVHATLIRVHRVTGDWEPRLAREWSASPDGRTYVLKLRPDAVFSDGAPVTARDVVFTFAAIYDERVASQMASGLLVDGKPLSVSALDDHTVQIVFPSPYGPGLALLDSVPILPSHKLQGALASGTFAAAWNVKTLPRDIVGAGPFVLEEYVPGQQLRFRRNPRFWGRPLPRLDEIDVQIVPEQNAEMLRLEAGQSDLMSDFARVEDLGILRRDAAQGKIQLVDAGVDIGPQSLWFDLAPDSPHAKDRPWLQREELRKAISYAVDRQAFVNSVFLGSGVPIYGPITPGHGEWYAPDLPTTPVDREKAKALLASIGLIDRDGNGVLEDGKGRPARFSILTTKGNTNRERAAVFLQDQLKKVGLAVTVDAVDQKQVVSQWGRGDYDAIYYGIQADSRDPARNPEFWMSSGFFHLWNAEQATPGTAWEARIDELMRKQSTTVNRDERRQLFREVQAIFIDHMPSIYFGAAKAIVAMSARVTGATPSVLPPPVLWNAEQLSVAPAARR
jgi:peptide/nickel transport system substrate-binding protein